MALKIKIKKEILSPNGDVQVRDSFSAIAKYKGVVSKMATLFFFLPLLSFAQDYSFDGTWEGTYYHQNKKLEIFFPLENSCEYSCSLKQNRREINCQCFLKEDNFFVLGKAGMFFQLSAENFNLKTNSEYSFYPEPIIEGDYSEYENY